MYARVRRSVRDGSIVGVPMLAIAWILTLAAVAHAQPTAGRQPTAPQGSSVPTVPSDRVPPPTGPARDPRAPAETGTSHITGQVVALDTGAPLRRAQVRVAGGSLRMSRAVLTDAQGRFDIKELPAGRYQLSATKGGYVTLQYGQRRPVDPGRQIEVADGQTVDKIHFPLPRGAVITGRVIDETGETVTDMPVTVLSSRRIAGRARLVPAGRAGMTNDIGQYRVFGLPPGDYYVMAGGRAGWMSGFGEGGPEDSSGYAPTYYPGTPSATDAQRVSIGIGEETTVDLQLIPTRVSRISGVIADSTGRPLSNGMLTLQARDELAMGGMTSGIIRPDGTFLMNSVQPGSYYIVVRAFPAGRGDDAAASQAESVTLPLTVTGQDIENLRLATTRGGLIKGRIVWEGGAPPTSPSSVQQAVFCESTTVDGPRMMMGPAAFGRVDAQSQFEVKDVFMPCLLRPGQQPSQDWALKAVLHDGDDITDRPIDLSTIEGKTMSGVEVVMTNRLTTVSGTVTDAKGQPLKDYVAIVFSADREKWRYPSRHVRIARPDQDGMFKLKAMPPGEYLVVAVDSVEPGFESDPDYLTQLRPLGTVARLSEGGTETLTLKLSAP